MCRCAWTCALLVTGWVNRITIGWPTPIPLWATAAGVGVRFAYACAAGVIVVMAAVADPVVPAGLRVAALMA